MSVLDRQDSLDLLFAPFRIKIEAGLNAARADGLSVYPFETWRSPERQEGLYAQGRSGKGPVVTNARAWQSWHQYGLACDMAFGGPGKWSWNGPWERLGTILVAEGLTWYGAPGAHFKETPHFQFGAGLTLTDAKAAWDNGGGLAGVWAAALSKMRAAETLS